MAVCLAMLVPAHSNETPAPIVEKINELQYFLDLLAPDLFKADAAIPTPDVTIRVTGAQWFWSYQYEAEDGTLTDASALVVPVDQVTQLAVTSTDVIHEFSISAFAVKVDGVPGMIATAWFKPSRVGTYFGQCSVLCGSGFAGMIISINVVSGEDYSAWRAGIAEGAK